MFYKAFENNAMNDELLESIDSGIATLTLNRPAARNALTPLMMEGLRESLPRLAADTTVRVVVLTGAGDAFCAGMLMGIHEGWDLKRSLFTGVCAAAANLSDPTCTGGMKRLSTVLALAKKYKPRASIQPKR